MSFQCPHFRFRIRIFGFGSAFSDLNPPLADPRDNFRIRIRIFRFGSAFSDSDPPLADPEVNFRIWIQIPIFEFGSAF